MATKNNPRYTPKRIGENQYFVFDNKTGKTTDHLGRHPQFEKQVKEVCDQLNSPLPTPVGELPEYSRFGNLFVNESGHPDTGAIQIGCDNSDYIAEMYEHNDPRNDPGDNISPAEALALANELVKRYNAYPSLLKSFQDIQVDHLNKGVEIDQLQEQIRVLVEALENLLWCFEGKDGSNYSTLQLSAIKQGRNAIKLL